MDVDEPPAEHQAEHESEHRSEPIDMDAYREARQFHRALLRKYPEADFAETYRRFVDLWRTLTPQEREERSRRIAEERRSLFGDDGPDRTPPGRGRRSRRGAQVIWHAFR